MTREEALRWFVSRKENIQLSDTCQEAEDWAIEALELYSTWINIEEMLPEKACTTLICTYKGAVCTGHYYPQIKTWNSSAGRKAKYWMPLPKPPKEAKPDAND